EANTRKRGKIYPGTFPGCYTIVGTPDDVAEEMIEMSAAGLAGASICFLDYLAAMPYFIQEVLPRLERAGLRQSGAAGTGRATCSESLPRRGRVAAEGGGVGDYGGR